MRHLIITILVVIIYPTIIQAQENFGLSVESGSDISIAGNTGFGYIGQFDGLHLTFDGNEIQGQNGTNWEDLLINYWGGDIKLATRSTSTGSFNACNLLYVNRSRESVGIGIGEPLYKLDVNGDGSKSLDYISLIPILTKAIQEQQEIIDKQQSIINKQQKKMDAYDNELAEMRAELKIIKDMLKDEN